MIWKELNTKTAEKEIQAMKDGKIHEEVLSKDEEELRDKLLAAWQEAKEAAEGEAIRHEYCQDFEFALRMYEIFSQGEYAMAPRIAANPRIWSYIGIRIVPEIVKERWTKETSWNDRFFRKANRIYLKVLWWYIYLSWQGNMDATRKVLENNNADTVVQLVERAGQHGYRPELYRAIMHRYFMLDPAERKMPYFRKVMKLHTARIASIEPEMVQNGIKGYVEELFDYFKCK